MAELISSRVSGLFPCRGEPRREPDEDYRRQGKHDHCQEEQNYWKFLRIRHSDLPVSPVLVQRPIFSGMKCPAATPLLQKQSQQEKDCQYDTNNPLIAHYI